MRRNEQRNVVDRRRWRRGGRRNNDRFGYSPMVAVVDQDSDRRDLSETILAKLHFAVAPFDSVEKAISTMQALRPEIIVARPDAAEQLRGRVPNDRNGRTIPLLVVTEEIAAPDVLVAELRRMLRNHVTGLLVS